MYWVYTNLFFFFSKNNFFFNNFFFLNYFNNFTVNLISNYNFVIKLPNKKLNSLKFNAPLFKYIKYFNKIILFKDNSIKINQLNYYSFYKNFKFYSYNSYNYFYLLKILNLIHHLVKEDYNYIILDKSYKNIFPLYNYIFNFNNLLIYKKYFFIKSSFFSYPNWLYHLNKFFKKFNIIFILIFNYLYFSKFFKILKNLNLPIGSLLPINTANTFVDYPVFLQTCNNFENFLFFNLLTQTTLISINYKNYINKLTYLNLFYSFFLRLRK